MFNFLKRLIKRLKRKSALYIAFDSGGKHKPTIVLLHGIAATSKTWKPLLEELDTESNRVIVLDLLGFGKSVKPVGCNYTVEDHVSYVRKTLKKLKIKKPYKLVGHSMGAIIAARYGTLFSKDIEKLYLLSLPIYHDLSSATIIARKAKDFYLRAYEFMLQNKDFTIKNSQLIRSLLRVEDGIDITESNWDSFRLSLKNTIIKQNTYDDIQNTKVPICIMYGSFDELLVQEMVNKLAFFENVEVIRLSAVSHLVGERFSKEVAKNIMDI